MDLNEKKAMEWIDDSKNRKSVQSNDSNIMSRILRAAVASFSDLFDDPKFG